MTPLQHATLGLQEWINALRSGDYAQGSGKLCRVDADDQANYCCLGVKAELDHGEGVWKSTAGETHLRMRSVSSAGESNMYYPVELSSNKAHVLAGMNDNGSSFAEIADYLEGVMNGTFNEATGRFE